MPGVKTLRRIQFGKETTSGTLVAATTRWRGTGVLKDLREVEEHKEEIGIIGGADRTDIVKIAAQAELAATPLTFEQFQYLLAMSFGGPVTGSADGVGTDKIYTTTIPTTAQPTLVTYSVEGGDNFEVETMEYAHCTKWSIVGAPGKVVTMAATLQGRQVARKSGGFTGAATIPAVDQAPFQKAKVYLDAIGGVAGTTQVANAVLGFKIDAEINIVPKWTADGNLYWSFPVYTDHVIKGEITFEHDTAVDGSTGAKVDWRAQTPKMLQIKLEGNSVATGGTTYQKKTVIFNLPIKWKVADPLSDMNKNDTIKMQFVSRYNATAATSGSIIVVNELSTLP